MADPLTSEAVALYTNSAVGFTTANFFVASSVSAVGRGQLAQQVLVTLEGNDARYHLCGLTPATDCGHIWTNGDAVVLFGIDSIRKFKACNTNAATSTMIATFFF